MAAAQWHGASHTAGSEVWFDFDADATKTSVMQLVPDAEFVGICRQVADQACTDEDWADRESDDWFQTPNFCGGYDADERAFCFSYYDASGNEWWFQVSLSDARMISAGGRAVIELRRAQ